ncbi:hypothetical protein OH76DRAFT_811437 [Lentinus brumalis]|uniref:Uncharacterized protein n=1 Tax=Lentinus brumalis TaxID=2498619 RepID=A0A371D308_9APHY|nr:hypothetical protein OH76DRAFT_811437 [Polyporus brumalis]
MCVCILGGFAGCRWPAEPLPTASIDGCGSAGSPEVEAVSFRMGRAFVNLSRPQGAVISPTRGWYRGDRLCVLPGVASPMRYPGGTACWWFGLCESSMCIGQSSILSSASRYPAAGSCHVEYVWPSTARLPVCVIVFCAAAGPSAPAVAQPCLGGALRQSARGAWTARVAAEEEVVDDMGDIVAPTYITGSLNTHKLPSSTYSRDRRKCGHCE